MRSGSSWSGSASIPASTQGDQIFFNDPYVAGSHTYDQMVIMPIFHEGKLIAWTASSSHTADTGGLLRGGATEIYHEGIRILGVKVVERGEFREDVFKTIVEQCRDPEYVGLDLKSRIAANNVCNRRFLQLVERFGPAFVEAAAQSSSATPRSKPAPSCAACRTAPGARGCTPRRSSRRRARPRSSPSPAR